MFVRRMFEYHPVIGFRYIPNIRVRCPQERGASLVRTNSAGFRSDHEFTAVKTPRKRRILLFGDSFTAGNGVSNCERYGDQLEKLIPDLEVFNLGLPGTGTDQQYLAYREYGRQVAHDLLIIGILVENIRRVSASCFFFQRGEDRLVPKPYYELQNDKLILKNVPVPKETVAAEDIPSDQREILNRRFVLLRRLANRLGIRDIAQRLTRYQPVPEYNSPNNPAWTLMRKILETWIGESFCPVLLFPIPLYQFVEGTSDPSAYRRRFRELAASAGCALHDPLDDLMRYSQAERRGFRFEKDIHLTPQGHRALAESLAPVVTEMLF